MYEYVLADIILGIVWIIVFLKRPDLKTEINFAGVVALLFVLTEPLFLPRYYNPPSIFMFNLFGLSFVAESFFFLFFSGGISAVVYEEMFNKHLIKEKTKNASQHFYTILMVIITLMIFFGIFMKFEWIHATIVSGIITGILLAFIRKDLVNEMIFSGISFMILYFGTLIVMNNLIFSNFAASVWTTHNLGVYIAGIPIEEALYALLFGIVWAPLYKIFKGYKLK